MAVLKQFLTSPKLLTIFLSNTFLIHRSATLNISRSGDHRPRSTMLLCGLLESPSPLPPRRSLCFSLVPLIRFADRAAACAANLNDCHQRQTCEWNLFEFERMEQKSSKYKSYPILWSFENRSPRPPEQRWCLDGYLTGRPPIRN